MGDIHEADLMQENKCVEVTANYIKIDREKRVELNLALKANDSAKVNRIMKTAWEYFFEHPELWDKE